MRSIFLSSIRVFCLVFLSFLSFQSRAQYCTPSFVLGCSFLFDIDDINTFKITGEAGTLINDVNTGCVGSGAYDDRTSESVTLLQSTGYTVSINSSTTSDNVEVFIDFNNSNSFTASESVGGMNSIASTPTLSTFTINIPAGAALGTHRMRVIVGGDGTYPGFDPCAGLFSGYGAGEVHDYTVVITGTSTTCTAVTGLAASSITASAATISWTAVTGAIGYEWVVNTTAADPAGAGTATTLTTANATGLTASTAYYAHVRTKCSASSFSAWVTIPFTTLSTSACAPVTGLTASAVTSSAATISWTAVTGAAGYEWTVNTTAADPTTAGTATTLTTANASGLTASTTYYAHVRTNCGTSFSAWTTIPFTTLGTTSGCGPVTGLTASSITTTSAIVSWTAVTGSVGYKYVINTTAADPTTPGTFTTLTTTTATGLTPATTYYAHVKDSCGPGNVSGWVTIPFTTLSAGCAAVTGLTASAITTTTATISWTAVTGSLGYQYVVNNSVTPPTGSGTNTTATTANITALTPGTTYYAHVRDSCGLTSFSAWVTIPFTTLTVGGCNAVTLLADSAVTSSSATIYWIMATGAIGAEYTVNTTSADPTTAGTSITATHVAVTGLTAATTYYAHVRDMCSASSLSAWVTIPLTTLGTTAGLTEVSADNGITLTAYPNPVRNMLMVRVEGFINGEAQLQLTDITGKLIKTITAAGRISAIDMQDLPSGIYLVRYTDGANRQTIKVSKQ